MNNGFEENMPKLSPSVKASTSLDLEDFQFGASTSSASISSPRATPMRNYYDLADNDWEDVSDDNDENYQPNESNRESSETESEVDNKKINQKESMEVETHIKVNKEFKRKRSRNPEEWARNKERKKKNGRCRI